MTMWREFEPQQYIEKSKFLNWLDEAFGFICIQISRDILFHLEWLRTRKELWDKLESLFGKQDELRPYCGEWTHWTPSQQLWDISTFLFKLQSTRLAMQTTQFRNEAWATCGVNFEQVWPIIISFCIHIPLRKIIHPKLENSFSRCICIVIDPRERQIDSDGISQFLKESMPLNWRL